MARSLRSSSVLLLFPSTWSASAVRRSAWSAVHVHPGSIADVWAISSASRASSTVTESSAQSSSAMFGRPSGSRSTVSVWSAIDTSFSVVVDSSCALIARSNAPASSLSWMSTARQNSSLRRWTPSSCRPARPRSSARWGTSTAACAANPPPRSSSIASCTASAAPSGSSSCSRSARAICVRAPVISAGPRSSASASSTRSGGEIGTTSRGAG